MSRQWPILVHWDGQMTQTTFGTSYVGGRKKSFRVRATINFTQLVQKITRAMQLEANQYVSKITYRLPLSTLGYVNYGDLEIEGDDTVVTMFETVEALSGVSCIELFVEVGYTAANVEAGEADVGTSNTERDVGSWPAMMRSRSLDLNEAGPSHYQSPSVGLGLSDFGGQQHHQSTSLGIEDAADDWVDIHATNNYQVMSDNSEDDMDDADTNDEDDDDDRGGEETRLSNQMAAGASTSNMATPIPMERYLPQYSDTTNFWQINAASMALHDEHDNSGGQWTPDQEFFIGQVFPSKENVQHALKVYSIHRNQEFFVIESTPMKLAVKCKRYEEGCCWRLRAVQRSNVPFWRITRYVGPHSCSSPSLTLGHSQLDSSMIAALVLNMVKKDATVKVSVLAEAVHTHYNYHVSYHKV